MFSRKSLIALISLAFLFGGCSESKLDYPVSKTVDQVDQLHGTDVKDPYRWLEDLDSEETAAWVEAQSGFAVSYLSQLPKRQALQERLTKLWNYEKYGVPRKKAGRYFYSFNNGLQNQSVIYWLEALDAEAKVLIDPNTLSEDGTVALSGYQISPDGKLAAYGIATAGSDWQEWKVRNVDTGDDLADHIKWIKFSSVSWSSDGKGFYYSRYDEPKEGEKLAGTNYYHKLFYHLLGTQQSEDTLVYERPDQKEWGFSGNVSEDGKYLVISVWKGSSSENGVLYKELGRSNGDVVELLLQFDARYEFIGNSGSTFWFQTDLEAPRGKIIQIDVKNPARENWKVLVDQTADTLQGTSLLNKQFICLYLHDASNAVRTFNLKGEALAELDLPELSSITGFTGDSGDAETFYSISSFSNPGSIYRLDLKSGESTEFRAPAVDFDPADYETRQVFYESKDGTRVPMFVSYKKGLELNGSNPTILYGYGGFNISETPFFSVTNLVWMEQGGVFALANLRGGGEYGEEWHQGGMKLNKQNVFDDFFAAAEWLIANQFTSSSKLAVEGGSNGGLLVGAVITQRPELAGVAIPHVGVMDMLRFHKFTIGWAWVSDFGSPDDPEEFKALYAYSPYHNIKPETEYPATLITTADHDDRVVPSHSFKFGAALQAAQKGPNPILLRIETKAGHGAGKPTSKRIEEAADKLAFVINEFEKSK